VINAGGDVVMESGYSVDLHQDGLLITGKHPGCVDVFVERFKEQILAI